MRSRDVSLRSHFRCLRVVQSERGEVVKNPQGREGKTREGRADQGEVRIEEVCHPEECGGGTGPCHDGTVMKRMASGPTVERC